MRIITEDNIDQLTNLSYQSRNIDKLLHIDHGDDGTINRDIKEIVENYKRTLESKLRQVNKQIIKKINPKNEEPQLFEEDGLEQEQVQVQKQEINQQEINQQEINQQVPPSVGPYVQPNSPQINSNTNTNIGQIESPEYHTGSPLYVPESLSLTGGSNIFPEDSNMNTAFNMLDGSSQAKILQMDAGQRRIVMGQIMRQSAGQLGGGINQQNVHVSNTPLAPYFQALPVKDQLSALQLGYNSMSKEFNKLSNSVNNEKITISKPQSIQQQLYEKLPLLSIQPSSSIKQNGGDINDTSVSTNANINTSTDTHINTSTIIPDPFIKKISIN